MHSFFCSALWFNSHKSWTPLVFLLIQTIWLVPLQTNGMNNRSKKSQSIYRVVELSLRRPFDWENQASEITKMKTCYYYGIAVSCTRLISREVHCNTNLVSFLMLKVIHEENDSKSFVDVNLSYRDVRVSSKRIASILGDLQQTLDFTIWKKLRS